MTEKMDKFLGIKPPVSAPPVADEPVADEPVAEQEPVKTIGELLGGRIIKVRFQDHRLIGFDR